jgi:hypothetical protein
MNTLCEHPTKALCIPTSHFHDIFIHCSLKKLCFYLLLEVQLSFHPWDGGQSQKMNKSQLLIPKEHIDLSSILFSGQGAE